VRELEPLHAQLRQAQRIIDAGAQRRPAALPEANVLAAKKALPGLQAKAEKAAGRARKIDSELSGLGWWRPFKKSALRRDLELAKQDAAALQTRLAACKATAAAAAVEVIDRVVAEQKALQAELAPRCWPLERELRERDAAEALGQAPDTGLNPPRHGVEPTAPAPVEASHQVEHEPTHQRERERQR
jgi:hypothetical protein